MSEEKSLHKFGIGDKVKIVNYGAPVWFNKRDRMSKNAWPTIKEDKHFVMKDMYPEVVGQEGIVKLCALTQKDEPQYSLDGIKGKSAWYTEEQLELITKNTNT